jgi:hypothetical protein
LGLKTWEVTEDWNKLHEEELGEIYCSPNNIRVSRSRKMEQAVMGVTGVMWRRSVMHIVSLQSLKKREHVENIGVEGRKILKLIVNK